MRKLLVAALLLLSFAAEAAPWSSRWTTTYKSATSAGLFTIQSQASANQVSPRRLHSQSSGIFRTPTQALYTGSTLGGEIQIDIQPQSGASANALGFRTKWIVTTVELQWSVREGFVYHLSLSNDPTDGSVDPSARMDFYLQDPTAFGVLAPSGVAGTAVYVDFGNCSGTCLTTL